MKKSTCLFLALVLYFGITFINEFIFLKGLILPLFPDGYIKEHFWIRQHIHHFGQMLLALLVIILVLREQIKDYGLILKNRRLSLKYALWFFLAYGIITILNFLPNFLSSKPESFGFSPTAFNILGWLSFELLMSGASEEIFFRGLLQTYLCKAWKGSVKIIRINVPTAGIIAALIFTFAHIEINFNPFAINYNLLQVVMAFILGIFYSIAYDRTRSLLAPILTHNFANFIMYFVGYLTFMLFS